MDFQIDQQALLDLAAEKLADQYADFESIGCNVDALIRERVDKAVGSLIEERVEAALNAALEKTLNESVQPVNIFGEKVGEPTSIKATLVERAADFWNTKVKADGRPFGKGDTWGRKEAKTRAEWMLGRIVSDEFMAQVRANSVEIAETFKAAMREDAHALVDRHLDAIINPKNRR